MLKRYENADFSVVFEDCHIIYQSLSGLVASEHDHVGHELFLQLHGESVIRTAQSPSIGGAKSIESDHRLWTLTAGHTLFVPSHCRHELVAKPGMPAERLILLFEDASSTWRASLPKTPVCMVSQQILSELLLFILERPGRPLAAELARNLKPLVAEILNGAAVMQDAEDSRNQMAEILQQASAHPLKRQDPRLKTALELWILPEWEERSVQELAHAVGVSAKTITRLFRSELGASPVGWRNQRRLDEACRLLRETELRVLDVAYEAGYGSLSRFMEAFRLHFGLSPSEYRKRSGHRS